MRRGFTVKKGGSLRRKSQGDPAGEAYGAIVYAATWEGSWEQLCNFAIAYLYASLEDAQDGVRMLLRVNPAHRRERPPNIPDDGWMSYLVGDGMVIRRFCLVQFPGG